MVVSRFSNTGQQTTTVYAIVIAAQETELRRLEILFHKNKTKQNSTKQKKKNSNNNKEKQEHQLQVIEMSSLYGLSPNTFPPTLPVSSCRENFVRFFFIPEDSLY